MKINADAESGTEAGLLIGKTVVVRIIEMSPSLLVSVTMGFGPDASSDVSYRMRLSPMEAREFAELLLASVENIERGQRGLIGDLIGVILY